MVTGTNVQSDFSTAQTTPTVNQSKAVTKSSLHRPWMNRSLTARERADLLLKQMTLEEKIQMVHGVDPKPIKGFVGYAAGNPRLGIPALTLANGRAAVGDDARDVTLLPAPIAAVSGWDTSVMEEFGRVLGREEWIKGTNVALGPSIDVVRVPQWGRTFESYGEDPYFNSRMAVAEINGIQSQGPIADANMYVTMNQESNRLQQDSVVDERTLQEIYLPPFAAAIRDAHVGTVMCAYVKTNGVYSCESEYLLHEVLRKQLKFDGWVMSDWGATHSTVDSANHGLDQQMPDAEFFGARLKAAVGTGQVRMEILDGQVRDILVPMFRQGLFDRNDTGAWSANARSPQHDAFARKAAQQGMVLLKNEKGILPISPTSSIAIIGVAGSTSPAIEGGGSSLANSPYVVSPLNGIRTRTRESVKIGTTDGSDLDQAASIARSADIAIVFVKTEETEGSDRPDLRLPGNQDALVAAVAGANPRTIVVLETGGPILMPWLEHVSGVIEAWYAGQEAGNAISAILYGDVNPSAKLPLTFPRAGNSIPTSQPEQWPGVNYRSLYSEGLNVGYRWYDATGTQPLFPFGFGLSYTTFAVSHLTVEQSRVAAKPGGVPDHVRVKVNVTNTGRRQGAEVVQIYVGDPPANGEPPHQLKAFSKVELNPGETKTLSFALGSDSFSTYDATVHLWKLREGRYDIFAGTSSRDLPLHGAVYVRCPFSRSEPVGSRKLVLQP
jgi:beta-glucosidase